jgi:flagellar hook-length control protein FliK
MQATSVAVSTANVRSAAEAVGTRTAEKGSPAVTFADLLLGAEAAESKAEEIAPASASLSTDLDTDKADEKLKKLKAGAEELSDLTPTLVPIKDQQAPEAVSDQSENLEITTLDDSGEEQPQVSTSGTPQWSAWVANLLQVAVPATTEPKLATTASDEAKPEQLKGLMKAAGAGDGELNVGAIADLQTKKVPVEKGAEAVKAIDAPIDTQRQSAGAVVDAAGTSASKQTPADTSPAQTLAASRVAPPEASTTAVQLTAPAVSPTGAKESPPPPSATFTSRMDTALQTHLNSAGFTPAFSARVATLVRDGVEHARVHLNPVDMGPVSLQMSLDGQQVRVDMTADLAATRRVLEQALPTLAGALREAGFTLSGGGVHQPPPEPRSGAMQDAGPNMSGNSQGSSTADTLGTAAGGAGGQGQAANPFRQDPRDQGAQTPSGVITVGEETLQAASGSPSTTTTPRGSRLVDVFA